MGARSAGTGGGEAAIDCLAVEPLTQATEWQHNDWCALAHVLWRRSMAGQLLPLQLLPA